MDPHLPLVLSITGTSLVVQKVKILPTVQETWVQSLGGEDPLEQEMTNHASILAWEIPWIEELGGLESMGRKELDMQSSGKGPNRTLYVKTDQILEIVWGWG